VYHVSDSLKDSAAMDEAEVIDISTWEARMHELAAEKSDTQIRLPSAIGGRRVNREEIANAFLTSFEMVGGVPRLAYWADQNYGEFVKIFGRLLPKETLTTHNGEIVVKHAVAPSKLDE
jgi:hypothetical protein